MNSVYFDPALGGDGSTLTDDANALTGLASGGHRARFVPALANVLGVANFAKTKAIAAAASESAAAASAGQAADDAASAASDAGQATTKAGESAASAAAAQASAINAAATAGAVGFPPVIYDARAANAQIQNTDIGNLIDLTGTFTQTFAAANTYINGWWCYIRNAGSGDITLDPLGTETIDGIASYVMYPGETRLLMCNGVAFRSVVITSFYRVFTASAPFVKPPGYKRFGGYLWGGGSGGHLGYGGNGGTCVPFDLDAAAIAATESVVIGSGGAAGADGGNSVFAAISSGAVGKGNTYGTTAYGRNSLTGPVPPDRFALPNPGYGDYGGGKGSSVAGAPAGYEHSIYGGAGGVASGPAGTSVFGGAGGVGAGAGVAPGGGGGTTGAGARGELRIWGQL